MFQETLAEELTDVIYPPCKTQLLKTVAATKNKDVGVKRLCCTKTTFCKSLRVTFSMSKLCCTSLIFVDPEVEVNEAYYCDLILLQQYLRVICQVPGEFVLMQNSALA